MQPDSTRRTRVIAGLLGLSLLFGPWLAFAVGARSTPIATENRALAAKPTWKGFATLQDIADFAADHFPLRDDAVRANKRFGNVAGSGSRPATAAGATLSTGARIATPTLEGTNGWRYLAEDFNRACQPELALDNVIDGLERLHRIITGSGRRFVFSITPDKSSFDPQYLPDRYPLQACSTKAKAERRQRLTALRLSSFLDVVPVLKADERSTGQPAYLALDSHWTDRSSALFVKAVAERLDPALANATQLRASHTGKNQQDLAVLVGDNLLTDDTVWAIDRAGVTARVDATQLAPGNGYEIRSIIATTTGPAALFVPKTLWIGDSFSDRAVHHYSQYFANLLEIPDLTKAALNPRTIDGRDLPALMLPRLLDEIEAAEVIVLQAVERYFFAAADGSFTTDEFLDRLEAKLTTRR